MRAFLFGAAFGFDGVAFAGEFGRSRCCRVSRSMEAAVSWSWRAVEEGSDICGLRGHLRAGSGDDLWLQTETLPRCCRTGGSPGDTESQLVGWGEGELVEPYCGV